MSARPVRLCLICIQPLERIYGNQKTCGSPRCQQLLKEWRKLQKRGFR